MTKVYFGFESTLRYKMFTVFSFTMLLVGMFLAVQFGNWYYIVLLIFSVILNLLWMIMIISRSKTRVELNERTLRAPYYIWYEGFEAKIDSKLMIEELAYEKIKSMDIINVNIPFLDKTSKGLKLDIENSFIHVFLLDRFTEDEQSDVIHFISEKVKQETT